MKIIPEFEQFIENQGWTIVCQSPLELSHEDGSFASMQAAKLALSQLNEDFLEENPEYKDVADNTTNSLEVQENMIKHLVYINNKVQDCIKKALAQQSMDDETIKNGGYVYEAEKLWDVTFHLVFNDHISHRARQLFDELNITFEWYDPDTSYQEDVMAYADALNEKVSIINTLVNDGDNNNRRMRY